MVSNKRSTPLKSTFACACKTNAIAMLRQCLVFQQSYIFTYDSFTPMGIQVALACCAHSSVSRASMTRIRVDGRIL